MLLHGGFIFACAAAVCSERGVCRFVGRLGCPSVGKHVGCLLAFESVYAGPMGVVFVGTFTGEIRQLVESFAVWTSAAGRSRF